LPSFALFAPSGKDLFPHAALAISEKILYSFHNSDKLEITSLNREDTKSAKKTLCSWF
jgi:hypothetical protein